LTTAYEAPYPRDSVEVPYLRSSVGGLYIYIVLVSEYTLLDEKWMIDLEGWWNEECQPGLIAFSGSG
jgi:hypothetical protein